MSQQEAAAASSEAPAGGPAAPSGVRPVSLEWGGQVRGLPLLLGGQIISGLLLGVLIYGATILTNMYAPLLGAVVVGWLLGLLARDTVTRRGGFDNFLVGALCCTLGAVAAFGAYHTGRYFDFVNQLDADVDYAMAGALRDRVRHGMAIPAGATEEDLDRYQNEFIAQENEKLRARGYQQDYRQWLRSELRTALLRSEDYQTIGNDSFGGYMLLEMRRGIIFKMTNKPGEPTRFQGMNWGPAGNIGYRIGEIALAAGMALWPLVGLLLVMPRTRASHNRLKHNLALVYLSPDDPIRLTRQVAEGGAASIDKGQAVEQGNFPAVELSVRTPGPTVGLDGLQEAGEPEVVLELNWVARTARGDLRHRRLGRWWYPVSVLASITKRFGPPPPPLADLNAADQATTGN